MLYAVPALGDSAAGFWSGYADGLLAVVKLLASLVVEVDVVADGSVRWSYKVGFYLGLLSFAVAAGLMAGQGRRISDER